MPQSPSSPLILRVAETLAVAALGGIPLGLADFPAGWLSGSMVTVIAAALMGRQMVVPAPMTRVVFVVLGASLGAVVTPATVRGIASWPASIVFLSVSMVVLTAVTASYLRFVHRWDALSALLAAAPGAFSQMMVLATELKADVRAIAIVQTTRVVALAVGLPVGLASFGLAGPAAPLFRAGLFGQPLGQLAVLAAVSAAGAIALHWIRFPGGLIFGSMMASAVLHGAGLIEVVLPWWLVAGGMICLGAITGARFSNTSPRLIVSYLGAALGSFLVAVGVAASLAVVLAEMQRVPIANVVIAFAPGALDAMMILALAINVDPVFVGAHHLARFLLVALATPLAARRLARPGQPPAPAPSPDPDDPLA